VDFLTNATILSSPAVTGGRTVFGSSNGHVYCLEPADR
jgi:outer membrane protein assembly factor BamB